MGESPPPRGTYHCFLTRLSLSSSSLDPFSEGYYGSSVAYLYTLNNTDNVSPRKLPLVKTKGRKQYAIFSHEVYLPCYGGGLDIFLSSQANKKNDSYSYLGHTYEAPPGYEKNQDKTKNFLAGSYYFQPDDLEMFYNVQ